MSEDNTIILLDNNVADDDLNIGHTSPQNGPCTSHCGVDVCVQPDWKKIESAAKYGNVFSPSSLVIPH